VRAERRVEADHCRAALGVGAAHLLLRGRRPAARAVRADWLPRHPGHRAAPPYSVVPLALQLARLQHHPAVPVAAAGRWHLAAGRRRREGCDHAHERLQPCALQRLPPYMSPGCNPMSTRSAATRCPSRGPDRLTATGGSRPAKLAQRLQPHGTQAATPRHPGCNPMAPGLQPHGTQAATPWHPGCNPMAPRLQPHGTQAATPRHPGCNPMAPRLQPHGTRAATPWHPGCNPTAPRLQPHGTQAATPRHPGCNPTAPRLQPHGTQAATPWHPGCNPMAPGLQPCTS